MIQVQNLVYTYPGQKNKAINSINFAIEAGEIFGFLGPSGSGKSTTQKILFKMLPNYEGSAKIKNQEVKNWDKSLYDHIGVGFELPNHYLKLTALENLNFFSAFYKDSEDPMALLEKVGLNKEANKKVGEFSKGMKMRLNFIRAIMHKPEILFLDEPTSGLDPTNARIIKDLIIEQKNQGRTIFITTHQMHDADELCDRVAFIADGELKALDTPSHLKVANSKQAVFVKMKNSHETKSFPLEQVGKNDEFIDLIKSGEIETIHSQEATLDEIFIQVTGKTLV